MSTDDTRSVSPQVFSRSTVSRRQLLASPLLALLGRMLGARPALAQNRESLAGRQLAKARSKWILQSEIDTFDVAFLPPPDLTFALVADTHTDKQRTSSPVTRMCFDAQLLGANARHSLNDPRTAKVYAQLNANRPAFMIHLGDLVHGFPGETWWPIQVKKANGLLRRLEIPSYLVPGNHDIGNKLSVSMPSRPWPGSTDNPRDVYYVSPRNIEIFERDFGPSFSHFESSGNLFLAVNAYAFNTGFETEERQWRWLEETLATSRDYDNVFLAMHPLPYWVRIDEPGDRNYEVVDEPARSRLLALCAEHDVRAIFTGHIHHDYVRYHGSMLIAGTPSTSFSRDHWGLYYPLAAPTWDTARAGYCQVRVRGRRIVRQFVRTVDLLPSVPICQEGNPFPPRRLMARQTGDGVPGIMAVTVPLICQHPGLSAPKNVLSRRHQGADRADEQRVAWVSGLSGLGEEWLEIRLAAPCRISRVVVHPGFHWRSKFEIKLRSGDGPWTSVARGEPVPAQSEGPAPPIEYQIGGRSATALRLLLATGDKHRVSVRGLEIFNQDDVDLTALPAFATATASSKERESGVVNTAAFSQSFDLNPSYIRLDPRATSFQAISPAPGLFNVDPWLVESVRHAAREGARIWGVLSAGGEGAGRRPADLKEFSGYCQALARALEGIDVWEINGDRGQVRAAMAAIGQVSANVRFAVSEKLGAPRSGLGVSHADQIPVEARQQTLLVRPPFPSRRQPELAIRLAQWFVACLDLERLIPCVSLLPGEGLLDGWDDPMTAFYVVRAFNTVLAGASPSPDHCRADPGLSTVHFASPTGRFIVAQRAPDSFGSMTIQLGKDAAKAWWIDPLTSTSRQLVVEERELRDLQLPSHPVILRLV